MKKRRKSSRIIALLIMSMALLFVGTSCGEDELDTIDVTFYMNDGTSNVFTTISGVPGQTKFVPDTLPVRDGYEFTGWYLDPDGKTFYSDGSLTVHPPSEGNFNVFAVWSSQFSVEFICEYLDIPQVFVEEGGLIEMPNVPQRDGYSLDGWYKDSSFLFPWDFMNDHVFEDIRLYAHWIAEEVPVEVEYLTIIFESNGGSEVDAIYDQLPGTLIERPKNPTRSGYTFGGWFLDQDFMNPWDFKVDLIEHDITLYARWSPERTEPVTFTVTFNSNGGSDVARQSGLEKDSRLTEPKNPTKAGYTFEGWFSDRDLTKKWNFGSDRVRNDMTLYAKWGGSANNYTVKFDSQGGSAVDSQSNLNKNDLVTKPSNPKKADHDFAGWWTGKNFSGKQWDFGYDRVTGNMTLFAMWTPKIVPGPDPPPPPPPPPDIQFNITVDPGNTGAFAPYVVRVPNGGKFTLPLHSIDIDGGTWYVWYTSIAGTYNGGDIWVATSDMLFVAQMP